MNQQRTLAALSLIAAFASVPAIAADEHNTVPGLTAAGAPLGLHGVDPVAFIELGNRIDGTAKYTAAFKARPARYSPENGGFCTFGVSVGKKFDGDPRYAAVDNGKLYVFLNEDIFRMFQKDRAGTIAKAKTQWTKIQHTASRDL